MPDSRAGDVPAYAVVLSAFNGAAHIGAQVESIRAQSASNWRLYVRDDGSRDDTLARVAAVAARDQRIDLLPSDGRNLGPAGAFGVLLEHALRRGERYVFPCDQDDVWLPGKCELMMHAMLEREAELGTSTPLLVHTDMRVVAEDLTSIHESFMELLRIDAAEESQALRLLSGNSVSGCASLLNAALLHCALPMPRVAMHDWWLAQCAAAFGEVHFIDTPTVFYRQHARNVVGARGLRARAASILRSPEAWWRDSARRFLAGLGQLWAIRSRARSRGLRMTGDVGQGIELLWGRLGGQDTTVISRLAAAGRSRALPRSFPMRGLFLARVALLPRLRARFGDERDGAGGVA